METPATTKIVHLHGRVLDHECRAGGMPHRRSLDLAITIGPDTTAFDVLQTVGLDVNEYYLLLRGGKEALDPLTCIWDLVSDHEILHFVHSSCSEG